MAERLNGKASYARRTHGSERRGVFATPSYGYIQNLEQSRRDRAQNLASLREKYNSTTFIPELMSPEEMAVSPPQSVEQDEQEIIGLGNRELPAINHKNEIIDAVENNKVVISTGATGSGKSTQIPQYLYEAGYDVFVVPPRRIIVDGLHERIQEELNGQLGEHEARNLVGKRHGGDVSIHDKNKISIMTPNVLNLMFADGHIDREYKDKKVAFLIDEIHERNLYSELALGHAAMWVRENPNARLIAASATLDAKTLQYSLGRVTDAEYPEKAEVPVVNIEGRPFNVEIHEMPDMTPVQAFVENGRDDESSLIFTSGMKEIKSVITETIRALEAREKGSSAGYEFRMLHGELTKFQMKQVARPAERGKKLVTIATPAGMSGITLPKVTAVYTDGTINREILDVDGHPGLVREYLSQSEVIQEIGRAGRDVAGGVGYICAPMIIGRTERSIEQNRKLYPFKSLDDRDPYAVPEIYNTDLSSNILDNAKTSYDFEELGLFTGHEVQPATIQNTKTRLRAIGALDRVNELTDIGQEMTRFPVAVELSRGLVESLRRERVSRQLAFMALTASAVDTGGLQEFRKGSGTEWKRLLTSSADDDFSAQLDLMLALREADQENVTPREQYLYAKAYDLNPRRVERARDVAGKILHRLGINISDINLDSPSYEEVGLLRDDFTAGMFMMTYREAGVHNKEHVYRDIRDANAVRFRTINDRSVAEPEPRQLIAGFPRYYTRDRQGEQQVKNVLDLVLRVRPEVVGRFALQTNLVDYVPIKGSARMDGGMVVEREQAMFGDIKVGSPEVVKSHDDIPETSQAELVRYSLQNPGDAQLALRSVAEELAEYRRIHTAEDLEQYRQLQAPADLTKHDIESILKNYAARTRNAQELDALLDRHMLEKGITIARYYDTAARVEMTRRSPEILTIGGVETKIFYDRGRPYVTRITAEQQAQATSPVYLDDGREVLHQIKKSGRGTRRVSFGSEGEVAD